MTSAESHPFSSDPLKSFWIASAVVPDADTVPMASATRSRPSRMLAPPMLAFWMDFQSMRRIVPVARAWDS